MSDPEIFAYTSNCSLHEQTCWFLAFIWEKVAPVNELCQLQTFEDYMLQAQLMLDILESGQDPRGWQTMFRKQRSSLRVLQLLVSALLNSLSKEHVLPPSPLMALRQL